MKNREQFLVIDSAMNNQELAPQANNLTCPRCQLSHIKRNGHTYYGKQNYRCLDCGRQFVFREPSVSDSVKQLICRLLLERISLRGICRGLDVRRCWLLNFMRQVYKAVPNDLNFRMAEDSEFEMLCLEADEVGSFVERKTNKQWIWLILERCTRQVVAVHIGDRKRKKCRRTMGKTAARSTSKCLDFDRLLGSLRAGNSRRAAYGVWQEKRANIFHRRF